MYNKIKICKNGAREFWSNLNATKRAKGGLSAITKDV